MFQFICCLLGLHGATEIKYMDDEDVKEESADLKETI